MAKSRKKVVRKKRFESNDELLEALERKAEEKAEAKKRKADEKLEKELLEAKS